MVTRMEDRPIELPKGTNYIAAFLSFACQLRCPYCINHHGGDLVKNRRMTGVQWIDGLSRISATEDLPITLQGGEPTVHKDFYQIARHKPFWGKMDLLTNGMMDLDEWIAKVDVEAFRRKAPYASIRVSYHIGQNDKEVIERVRVLLGAGYQVGIWAVDHPDHTKQIKEAQLYAWSKGIDFRLKEFLGPHGGHEYGTFRYPNAVNAHKLRYCECRTSEVLIAPDGQIYRCHSDLYASRLPIGNIAAASNPLLGKWVPCAVYGRCNSCDIKVKNDRHQVHGHSSVTIRNISPEYAHNNDFQEQVTNTYGKADAPAKSV